MAARHRQLERRAGVQYKLPQLTRYLTPPREVAGRAPAEAEPLSTSISLELTSNHLARGILDNMTPKDTETQQLEDEFDFGLELADEFDAL